MGGVISSNVAELEEEVLDLIERALRQYFHGNQALCTRLRLMAIARAKRLIALEETGHHWFLLGEAYVDFEKSRDCYLKALKLDPTHGEAVYELAGLEWVIKKNPRKAARLLESILDSPPPDLEWMTYHRAADIFEELGLTEKAEDARARRDAVNDETMKMTVEQLDPDWNKPDPLEIADRRKRKK